MDDLLAVRYSMPILYPSPLKGMNCVCVGGGGNENNAIRMSFWCAGKRGIPARRSGSVHWCASDPLVSVTSDNASPSVHYSPGCSVV